MSRSQMLLEKDSLFFRVSYLFSKAFIKILLKENRNNDMEIVNPFAISSNSEEEEESENKAAETIPEMMKMTKTAFDQAENIIASAETRLGEELRLRRFLGIQFRQSRIDAPLLIITFRTRFLFENHNLSFRKGRKKFS